MSKLASGDNSGAKNKRIKDNDPFSRKDPFKSVDPQRRGERSDFWRAMYREGAGLNCSDLGLPPRAYEEPRDLEYTDGAETAKEFFDRRLEAVKADLRNHADQYVPSLLGLNPELFEALAAMPHVRLKCEAITPEGGRGSMLIGFSSRKGGKKGAAAVQAIYSAVSELAESTAIKIGEDKGLPGVVKESGFDPDAFLHSPTNARLFVKVNASSSKSQMGIYVPFSFRIEEGKVSIENEPFERHFGPCLSLLKEAIARYDRSRERIISIRPIQAGVPLQDYDGTIAGLRIGKGNIISNAIVVSVEGPHEVTIKKTLEKVMVANVRIRDSTGEIMLSLWSDENGRVKEGDVISIEHGFVKSFRGDMQISLGRAGQMTVKNPAPSEPAV